MKLSIYITNNLSLPLSPDLSVAVVAAWDADDDSEGTNARLTYSIEKNVIDERSGEAIFAVHPETGLVQTALCCLDRETTPEYHIQVVATDGGGQKGEGQMYCAWWWSLVRWLVMGCSVLYFLIYLR